MFITLGSCSVICYLSPERSFLGFLPVCTSPRSSLPSSQFFPGSWDACSRLFEILDPEPFGGVLFRTFLWEAASGLCHDFETSAISIVRIARRYMHSVPLLTMCLGTARPKQSVRVTLELYTLASRISTEAIRVSNRSRHKQSTIFQEDRTVSNASSPSSSEPEF